jgi:hypothetical protein
MKNGYVLLNAFRIIGLMLTVVISMNAQAGLFGLGGDSWKEEVLLHDGQKIIVERSQTYGGRSEPGQSGSGPIKEHTIRFTLPGTNQSITWTSEYSTEAGRTNFNLLAVHVLKGVPYVVTEPNLCLSYNKWGRPNPPYVFFKYEDNTWQRIPLEQLPVEFKTINVAHNTLGQDAQDLVRMGLVPVERIKAMNRSSNPVYREILREALPASGQGCRVEYSNNKGTWLSIDWFKEKKDLAACMRVCELNDFTGMTCPCKQFFEGN